MTNFDPDAFLRGAQLTFVGAHRALQNPAIFRNEHYRQAALAVVAGIAIHLIVSAPIWTARLAIWLSSFLVDLEPITWYDTVLNALTFVQHSVLQVPFFLMTLMKHLSPALDQMFMESLQWVDKTYTEKHRQEDPHNLRDMYYPNFKQYSHRRTPGEKQHKQDTLVARLIPLAMRYGRKAGLSLTVYLLSFLPVVGKFVLPLVSFYTFRSAVGDTPAVIIFASGLVLPQRYLIMFLQAYFASRSLMRELLDPYFSRIQFSREQKKKWFQDREGVLFGFGVGFFILVKVPIVGVLVFGIAEASTAYLITKITDPPPPPSDTAEVARFTENQVRWRNKTKFLSVPFAHIDRFPITVLSKASVNSDKPVPTKQFT